MAKKVSIARQSLRLTGMFEAELLVELMLRIWHHPLATSPDFRNDLLESAAAVLRASLDGERCFIEIDPQNVNLVAAIWYAEVGAIEGNPDISTTERTHRRKWTETLKRSVPSCFCNPDRLS
jgi:hypothetical protein